MSFEVNLLFADPFLFHIEAALLLLSYINITLMLEELWRHLVA